MQKKRVNNNEKLIWDIPVRIFHWSLAFFFLLAWVTSEDDQWLDLHIFSGYAVMGLIIFRVIWGFTGSYYARFKRFSYDFQEVKTHIQGILSRQPRRYVGHNPAGSWAIHLLLTGTFLSALSGLFVFGGEENHGIASFANSQTGNIAHNLHEGLASLMLAIVAIHIGGVIVESILLKEKLVLSMINGRKQVPENTPESSPHKRVGLLLLMGLITYMISAGSGFIPGEEAFKAPFQGQPMVVNNVWQTECSDCHIAYHPSLLPKRSWKKLLDHQHDHFGEDLFLEPDTIATLLNHSQKNSAELGYTEPARKTMNRMDASDTPVRITETRYWRHKHDDIPNRVWKQSNIGSKSQCEKCHTDAKQGWFEDSAMIIPHPSKSK